MMSTSLITRSLQDKVNDYWRRKNERRYNYNGAITWNFLKNFTYRAEAGYDYTFFQQKDYYAALSDKAVKDGGSLPMGEWTKKDTWKLRLTHTLTYNKTFNKVHNLNAMIGHTGDLLIQLKIQTGIVNGFENQAKSMRRSKRRGILLLEATAFPMRLKRFPFIGSAGWLSRISIN